MIRWRTINKEASRTGRFLTQDSYTGNPYDPWTQHLYAYCGNNPVNMVDPTGHSWWNDLIAFAQQALQFAKQLAMVDGPAPVADVPAAALLVVAGVSYLAASGEKYSHCSNNRLYERVCPATGLSSCRE